MVVNVTVAAINEAVSFLSMFQEQHTSQTCDDKITTKKDAEEMWGEGHMSVGLAARSVLELRNLLQAEESAGLLQRPSGSVCQPLICNFPGSNQIKARTRLGLS